MANQRWSELDIIKDLSRYGQQHHGKIVTGIGDDCAVFEPDKSKHLVITADMLIDSVHFDSTWHPPFDLGRKCLAVNLSDIAAMGAQPLYVMLSIALPSSLDHDWFEQWLKGFGSMLDDYCCSLIGGDTVSGSQFTVSVTVLGEISPGRAILRSGARKGDAIFVSGCLGSAAAGLALCRNPSSRPSIDFDRVAPLIERHLNPLPDVGLGLLLVESEMVSAMQDISDGVATDLAHIASQSGVGARIEESLLPAHQQLGYACAHLGANPVTLQVSGGDDYHLVFTVKQGMEKRLGAFLKERGGPPIHYIGRIVEGTGVLLAGQNGTAVDISFRGYEHAGTD